MLARDSASPSAEAIAEARWERAAVRRSITLGLLVGIPLSALFLWLAVRGVQFDAVWDALRSISWPWLGGVAAGFAGTYAFFSLRWWRILNTLAPVSRLRVAAYVVSGAAISNVVPGRPGEFVRGYLASRATRRSVLTGVGTVVVDRTFDVIVLVVALLFTAPLVNRPDWVGVVLAFSVSGAVAVAALLVVAYFRRAHTSAPDAGRFRGFASALMRGLATIRSPLHAATLAALTVAAWACWAVAAWCCGQAVGMSLGFVEVVFLTAVVNLGLSIPSSPGFVGTFQWLCVSALSVFSVERSDAFAFAVVLHAMSLIPVTILGYAVLAGLAIKHTRFVPPADAAGPPTRQRDPAPAAALAANEDAVRLK